MRVLFGFPGWGWKMYGLASFRSGRMWFVGFSKQLPEVGAGETAWKPHATCKTRDECRKEQRCLDGWNCGA